ncbi:MAG TPA: hypothetical protein VH500_22980 [Nitrososphaeraceae archaeon]
MIACAYADGITLKLVCAITESPNATDSRRLAPNKVFLVIRKMILNILYKYYFLVVVLANIGDIIAY